MSLLVWLPLNGNLQNQGISDLKFNYSGSGNGLGTTTGGKLFDHCCQRTASAADCYSSDSLLTLTGDITISCWYYNLATATSGFGGIVSYHDHNTNGGLGINVVYSSDGDYRMAISEGHNSGRTYQTYYGDTNIYSGWHHLCVTYCRTTNAMNLYVDGVKDRNALTIDIKAAASTFDLFCWSTGYDTNSGYRTNCKLQDVRLYDSCLTAREVMDLANGLIVHYPMNRMDGRLGGRNFILTGDKVTGGSGATGLTSSYESDGSLKVVAASGNGNWRSLTFAENSNTLIGENFAVGDVYTVSFDMKIESGSGIPTLFVNGGNGYVRMEGDANLVGRWQRVYKTRTWAEPGTSYGNIGLYLGFSGLVGTYYFKNFKIEKGSKGSLYTPATWASTDIIDCSGYGNNGTWSDVSWSSEAALGDGSYQTNGSTSKIDGPTFSSSLQTCSTMTVWFNYGAAPSSNLCLIADKGSAHGLGFYSNGTRLIVSVALSKSVFAIDNYNASGWNFIAVVFDGETTRCYLNGVELTDTGGTNNWSSSLNNLCIGYRYTGSYAFAACQFSDYRLYATPLTADEIDKLYKIHIRTHNNNTYSAALYHEEQPQKFTATGAINATEFIEQDTTARIYKNTNIAANEIRES